MGAEHSIVFGPFRLDLADECLWCGEEAVELRPKASAVLRYLVEHAGRLVTKEELLDAVWPETAVVEAVLKVRISELREALQDNPATPQFIETVYRRGYRFIAPLSTPPPVVSRQLSVISQQKPAASLQLVTGNWPLTTSLVARPSRPSARHNE
jgi:DNA-binding winged helix-turn-helix (wHTH) protein